MLEGLLPSWEINLSEYYWPASPVVAGDWRPGISSRCQVGRASWRVNFDSRCFLRWSDWTHYSCELWSLLSGRPSWRIHWVLGHWGHSFAESLWNRSTPCPSLSASEWILPAFGAGSTHLPKCSPSLVSQACWKALSGCSKCWDCWVFWWLRRGHLEWIRLCFAVARGHQLGSEGKSGEASHLIADSLCWRRCSSLLTDHFSLVY